MSFCGDTASAASPVPRKMSVGGLFSRTAPADGRVHPGLDAGAGGCCKSHEAVGSRVSRNQLLAGLVLIGFANGISESIIVTLTTDGLVAALWCTFNISVIVWSACAISISLLLRGPALPAERLDWIVAILAVAAFLMPIGPLSWLVLSGLAIYILRTSSGANSINRGAWILLAMTVPMFWGRLLFSTLNEFILQGDAILVAWLVGTHRLGNAVQFVDGSGYLWIAPACSSLANISLAILCWVTVTKVVDRPSSLADMAWIILAGIAVVAINVTRITFIGRHPELFDLLHGPIGAAVTSWVVLGATLGICVFGAGRDTARRV